MSNLFILTQELNDVDEIENNINKLKTKDDSELFNITKYLKRPFAINIDYPTIKLIEDIISFNLCSIFSIVILANFFPIK